MPNPLTLLRAAPWLAILLLLGLFAWSNGRVRSLQRDKADLIALRATDKANIEAAAKTAQIKNQATIALVQTQQAAITERVSDDYESRLAALRANAQRVRQSPAANPGRANGDRASAVPASAGGVDGEAVQLPADRSLLAAEAELQLNALIDWLSGQSAIDPNPAP